MKQIFLIYSLALLLFSAPLHPAQDGFFTKLYKKVQGHPKIIIAAGLFALSGIALEVESHIHPKNPDRRVPAEPLERASALADASDDRVDLQSGGRYKKPKTGVGPLDAFNIQGVVPHANAVAVRYRPASPVNDNEQLIDRTTVSHGAAMSERQQYSPHPLKRSSPPCSPASSHDTEPLVNTPDSESFGCPHKGAELVRNENVEREIKLLCQEHVQQAQRACRQQLQELATENHLLHTQVVDLKLDAVAGKLVENAIHGALSDLGKSPGIRDPQTAELQQESKRQAAHHAANDPVKPISTNELLEQLYAIADQQTSYNQIQCLLRGSTTNLRTDLFACQTKQTIFERRLEDMQKQLALTRAACRTDCLDVLHQVNFLTKYINSEAHQKIIMAIQGEMQIALKELTAATQAKDEQKIEQALAKLRQLEEMLRKYHEDLPRQIKQQEVSLLQQIKAAGHDFAQKILARREIALQAAHQVNRKNESTPPLQHNHSSGEFSDEEHESDTVGPNNGVQKTEVHQWNGRGSEVRGNLTQALDDISQPQPQQPQKQESALQWAARAADRSYSDHGTRSKRGLDDQFHFVDADSKQQADNGATTDKAVIRQRSKGKIELSQSNGMSNGSERRLTTQEIQQARDVEAKKEASVNCNQGAQPNVQGAVQPHYKRIAKLKIVASRGERLKNGIAQSNMAPILEEMGKIMRSAQTETNAGEPRVPHNMEKPSNLTSEELNLGSDGEDDVIAAGESPAEKLLKQQEKQLQQQKNSQQQLATTNLKGQSSLPPDMNDPHVILAPGWDPKPDTPKNNQM